MGVLLPSVIIIVLVLLTGGDAGLTITEVTVESVDRIEMNNSMVVLQTITIENDFPLARRVEIPRYSACMVANSGPTSLSTRYSERDLTRPETAPIIRELFGYRTETTYTVEVPAHGSKEIEISAGYTGRYVPEGVPLEGDIYLAEGYSSCYDQEAGEIWIPVTGPEKLPVQVISEETCEGQWIPEGGCLLRGAKVGPQLYDQVRASECSAVDNYCGTRCTTDTDKDCCAAFDGTWYNGCYR